MGKHLSPQARRRLQNCLHGVEWDDLVSEIVDALEDAYLNGLVGGGDERAVIRAALVGESD